MPRKETSCSRIKQSWHAIARMYNNEAVKHDLTTTVGFILLNIDSHDGTPSTQIGPLMGMEATSLSRTLNILEQKKLIVRRRDKSDARIVRIHLTQKGLKKKEISKKTVKDFNKEVEELIGNERLKIFHDVIEEISRFAVEKKFNNENILVNE